MRLFITQLLPVFACLAACPKAYAIDAEKQISYVAEGDWVQPIAISNHPCHRENGDYLYRLTDLQWHAPNASRYIHQGVEILTQKGVGKNSEISITFDPFYQRVEIHKVQILRGDEVIDQLENCRRKVIHLEDLRDYSVYTNDCTLILLPDDLRVGDILEWSFTIQGDYPPFHPYPEALYSMGGSCYIDHLRYRIITEKDTPLSYKSIGGKEYHHIALIEGKTRREWIWEERGIEPFRWEEMAPSDVYQFPKLQLSSYESWNQVAKVASTFLKRCEEASPQLIRFVEELKEKYPTLEEQLLAAIRFVQDEIRYVSYDDEGQAGYTPRASEQVFLRRYGDCKDKTMLLVALCDLLGVESHPVLVHAWRGKAFEFLLPTSRFNHAITHLVFDGEDYFIDPTMTKQGGRLQTLTFPCYHYALIVDEATDGLTPIPIEKCGGRMVRERKYRIDAKTNQATFDLRITLTGMKANWYRNALEGRDLEELRRNAEEKYEDFYHILDVQLPKITDDRETNTYTLFHHLDIGEIGDANEEEETLDIQLFPLEIDSLASRKFPTRRKAPYALKFPFEVEEIVEIEVEGGTFASLAEITMNHENPYFEVEFLTRSVGESKKTIYAKGKMLRDRIEPEELPQFREALKALQKEIGLAFTIKRA